MSTYKRTNKQTNEFILYSMFNPNILLQDDVRMEEVGEEEEEEVNTSGLTQLADTLFQNQVNDFNSVSHELILINLFSV